MFGLTPRRTRSGDPARGGAVGVAVTATCARAAQRGTGPADRPKPIALGETSEELALACRLDTRPPAFGATGSCRTERHVTASNYLAQLTTPSQWQLGRRVFTPEAITEALFAQVARRVGPCDALGLAVPPTLTPAQTRSLLALAQAGGLNFHAAATAPLALAGHLLDPEDDRDCDVIVVDCDDHALTATRLRHDGKLAHQLATVAAVRLSLRAWVERLIDTLAERCVLLCRRDFRDAVAVEQGVYDQLFAALDRARAGLGTTLTVRHDHWVQDLWVAPGDWDGLVAPLGREAAESVRQFALRVAEPARAVWLTADAARLPGLLARLRADAPDATAVTALPATAVAEAAAALARPSGDRPAFAAETLVIDPTRRPRPELRHLMGG